MDRHRLKIDGVDGSHKNGTQKTERLIKKPTDTESREGRQHKKQTGQKTKTNKQILEQSD